MYINLYILKEELESIVFEEYFTDSPAVIVPMVPKLYRRNTSFNSGFIYISKSCDLPDSPSYEGNPSIICIGTGAMALIPKDAIKPNLVQTLENKGVEVILSEVFTKGSEGGMDLAKKVVEICETKEANFKPLYCTEKSIEEKINTIAKEIYRADGVDFTADAKKQIKELTSLGFDKLPICMAKTQYSFSDDQNLLGAPTGFQIML